MKTQIAFDHFEKATQQKWFTTALLLLRVALGFIFLYAAYSKFGDWSAAGYLASASGPFAEFFQSLAGSVFIDQLNIWGQLLIGAALILGIFVRPASFFGAVMMALYYLAHFEQNTQLGLIDQHIIYILIFVVFMAGGVGHVLGLDGLIQRNLRKQKVWWSQILFG
ncbi:DoxX family protein [Patescibacteria group bacterium]|nr:DoxX family protein [Patescibacteria group bacterium]